MQSGMALAARAKQVAANVRGVYAEAADSTRRGVVLRPLHDVVPFPDRLPDLAHAPVTRALDEAGRVRVRIGGDGIGELLGWDAGDLSVATDGHWVLLAPVGHGGARRSSGACALCHDGRLRLSRAVRDRLRVDGGDEVAVLVLPNHGVVGVCHPLRLFTGAPLALLAPDVGTNGRA